MQHNSESEQQNFNDADEYFLNLIQKSWEFKRITVPNILSGSKDIYIKKWVKINDIYDTKQQKPRINYQASINRTYQELQRLLSNSTTNTQELSQQLQKMTQMKKVIQLYQQAVAQQPKIKKFLLLNFIFFLQLFAKKNILFDNFRLRRHQLVHTGENHLHMNYGKKGSPQFQSQKLYAYSYRRKTYSCKYPDCQRKFSQSSNLTAHLKKHQNHDYAGINQYILYIVSQSEEIIDQIKEEIDEEDVDQ